MKLRRIEGVLIDTNGYNNCYRSASIQLLLGSCMYSFRPAKNSVSYELLENLNVVHKNLTHSKNGAVPFAFKMKLGSSSVKRSVLEEILLYVTAVDYSSDSSYSSGLQQ